MRIPASVRLFVASLCLVFLIAFFFAASFARSPLFADEVFLVFSVGQDFLDHPDKILPLALLASGDGWHAGRFVAPWMHLVGSVGAAFGFGLSRVLGIDLLVAFGLARALMFAVTVTAGAALVYALFPSSWSSRLRTGFLILSIPVFLLTMVSNRAYSSIRMQPWAYSAALAFVFFLLFLLVQVGKKVARTRVTVLNGVGTAVIGFLLGSTYELTQLFGPVGFLLLVWALREHQTVVHNGWASIGRIIVHPSVLLFGFSFMVPAFRIRLQSWLNCGDGCYSPSDVALGGIEMTDIISRMVSVSPFFSLSEELGSIGDYNEIQRTTAFALIFVMVASLLSLQFALRHSSSALNFSEDLVPGSFSRFGAKLSLLGVFTSFLLGVGAASSRIFQEFPLPVGASSIDTFPQAFAHSWLILGLAAMAVGLVVRKRKLLSFLAVGFFSLAICLSGLAFFSNLQTTERLRTEPGIFLQAFFASELNNPDISALGNDVRCMRIQQKLANFPEWEGHDRWLVAGLNRVMLRNHGVSFCSISEEDLFNDYGETID